MAQIKWIKLTTSMFDDEKIKLIESLPEADTILIIWIKLLSQAGKCNANGFLLLSEKIPYTAEMLSTIFNRPLNTVRLALDTFKNFGMIELLEDTIHITNWEKHQNIEGMDKIREQTKKRVAEHRAKVKQQQLLQQNNCNVTCNVTETQSNETDLELDLERDLEKDINNTCDSCEPQNVENTENLHDKKSKIDYAKIISVYHETCTSLPRVMYITDTRKKIIRSLVKSNPDFNFSRFFKKVNDSDFLSGRDGKWGKCCFDWIFKPANRIKILEGNYDNKKIAVEGGGWFD